MIQRNRLTDEDLSRSNIKKIGNDEIFVPLKYNGYEKNYWISNYGRLINNLRGKLFLHKQTVTSKGNDIHWKLYTYEADEKKVTDELAIRLMSKIFFIRANGRGKIYFKDKNPLNLYYKNIIYVTENDYRNLISDNMTVDELEYTQEYIDLSQFNNSTLIKNEIDIANKIEYDKKLLKLANSRYNTMMDRCYKQDTYSREINYGGCEVCLKWRKNKDKFIEWFIENYYEIDGVYNMNLDKDILVKGNKIYSPKTCCIVPNDINSIISTCHKPYNNKSKYPLGVKYDKTRNKYYATINNIFNENKKQIKLPYRNTEEEAFYDYKKHKEAYIIYLADKYIDYLPQKVYNALVSWNIEITD